MSINLDDLTLGQLKQIQSLIGVGSSASNQQFSVNIGKKCIIRTYASGVFFGELVAQSGREIRLNNCIRMWQWKAAESISLSDVSTNGVNIDGCKFSTKTNNHEILDTLEIIPCTEKAINSIESVKPSGQK